MLVLGGVARLNDAAATVWEQIEEARDREILIRRLRRRYHRVEDRTLRGDLDLLLDRWQRDRWIEWQDDPVFPFPEEPWPL